MAVGGAKRIFWGTGCSFTHPRPLLEDFEQFRDAGRPRRGLRPSGAHRRGQGRHPGTELRARPRTRHRKADGGSRTRTTSSAVSADGLKASMERAVEPLDSSRAVGGGEDERRRAVVEAVNGIADPCSIAMTEPIGIADLGLVKDVGISGGCRRDRSSADLAPLPLRRPLRGRDRGEGFSFGLGRVRARPPG